MARPSRGYVQRRNRIPTCGVKHKQTKLICTEPVPSHDPTCHVARGMEGQILGKWIVKIKAKGT